MNRKYQIELEQETDGRWIAEIGALLLGAMVYGNTRERAIMNMEALALRILARPFRAWRSSPRTEFIICCMSSFPNTKAKQLVSYVGRVSLA